MLIRWLARLVSTVFGLSAVLLTVAASASAHAVLAGSDPVDGARLAKAPSAVTLRFDESVGLGTGYLRVVDTAGRRVDSGSATHPGGDGTAVAVSLVRGLGDGNYLASFRVTSADSHPIAGSIRFVVGNGPLGAIGEPSGSTPVGRGVSTGLAAFHWLGFAGVALVGGSWLIFSIWPAGQRRRPIRRAIWAGWGFAAAGAAGELLLQGPYSAGTSLGTVLRPSFLDATLHINAGQLLSLRVVLLGVLGAILTAVFDTDERSRPSWGPEAAGIVGVGIVVSYAAAGHAQSSDRRSLAVLVDSLHLTSMIVWLGGLAILVIAALTRASETERADDAVELDAGMPIFSRVALTCVATLAVTGTVQAWWELGTLDAVLTTWYGRLLVAKAVLLGGLVGLGYLARRTVRRRDWAGRGGPLPRMWRTLLLEVAVGAVVLGVTGVLIALPPGKVALAAERGKPRFAVVAVTGQTNARVEVSPGRRGTVQISVELSGPVNPTGVKASASLPAEDLGPIPIELQAIGPRSYTASNVDLPSPGRWQVTMTVKTSEFDATTAVAELRLG